jgi:AcrR family transcriptional regulator
MPESNRPYRKSKRAEDEARTRDRIVAAAEALHGSVGPARTSISGVAERAGVTRATVYRHFPDDETLFLACSQRWLSRQDVPDPDVWARVPAPLDRLRTGLADIYRYYRGGEEMLVRIHRDRESIPATVVAARRGIESTWCRVLGRGLSRRRTVRAAVAHAIAFPTWQSLCSEQGLSDDDAVGLMVSLVDGA